jgi:hypothetical protein
MTSTTSAATTKLSDTQLILLSQAAQHPERALAIPDRLRGGAVARVVDPLLAKGLVEAVPQRGDLPVYKTEADGSRTALLITNTGLLAVGIEPEPATQDASDAEVTEAGLLVSADGKAADRLRRLRTGTKQELLIAMLKRPEGATVPEVVEATGWLPHTVRGAIAGALRKKLGLRISSEKVRGRARAYRIQG